MPWNGHGKRESLKSIKPSLSVHRHCSSSADVGVLGALLYEVLKAECAVCLCPGRDAPVEVEADRG